MSERYIKVFAGKENLYLEGAPVIILASALLKDTQTGKMLAQLKLQNISEKSISMILPGMRSTSTSNVYMFSPRVD